MMLKTTGFFADYIAALELKTFKLKKGTTLYRGSRFSVDNYERELEENRFFSSSLQTAKDYAQTSFGEGDPYVVKVRLSQDVCLYDIPYPRILCCAADGQKPLDVDTYCYASEAYNDLYRICFPSGGSASMCLDISPQDWQRLYLVDAVKLVIESPSLPSVHVKGYISELADETLLYPDALAGSEISAFRLSA